MDSWTDKQIRSLEVGGNENMRSFFQRKGVPSTLTIREKYHTEQASAYRKIIKSKVENTTVPSEDDIPQYVAPKKSTNKERGDYVGMSREKQRSAEAAARERMRNKFKNGMRGVGSNGGGSSRHHHHQGNNNYWIENSGAALQQTLGMAFEAASRQTSKLRERDWSKDRHAVKSEVSKGVSWLSTGVSTLWKSAKRAISDDNEPVRFYRDTNERPRSSGFGTGISSDDFSVVRKKTTLVEQRERRRSRSHSPKKNASNDWDNDDWGNDDDEFENNQVKKKNVATSSTNEQHKRLPTSEYDPFDLEKDFLGEIDAVLNDESDDEDVPSSSSRTTEPVSLPKPTSSTRKTTTTPTPTKPKTTAASKPKTVSGDDFFSSFGV